MICIVTDKIFSYLEEKKYFEAYGYQAVQYRLGPNIHFASILVDFYITVMETNRSSEAEELPHELAKLLQDKFANSTYEIHEYAKKLLAEKQNVKAFLFYQVVWHFEKEKEHDETTYRYVQNCVLGASQCAVNIHKKRKSESNNSIIFKIVAWMRTVQVDLDRAKAERFYALQGFCLLRIGETLTAVGEPEAAMSLYEEASALLTKKFGENVHNYLIHGSVLFKLGYNCGFIFENFQESLKILNKAHLALKNAQDYVNSDHRRAMIEGCERFIGLVRERLHTENADSKS